MAAAVAVVNMVILLEVAASVNMLPSVYKDVKLPLLVPLTAGSVVTTLVGTWLLATLSTTHLQWIVGSYMLVVALLTLSGFVFRQAPTRARLFAVGMVAGFFNGLAAVGGLSAAWAMIGFQLPVRDIRAVMTVFFIVAEVLFLSSAWGMGMISAEIITTAVLAIVPLALGIYIGSKLFSRFSEATLKRFVLIALIVLSVMGIYKSIF